MLRLIVGLLVIGVIKLVFNVGGFVILGIAEIIKFCLLFGFILAVLSAFDGNFLPIILLIGIPVVGIIRMFCNVKKRINKSKEKVILDDSDFVEIVDNI